MVLGNLLLVERRGRKEPIDPTRQVEIRTLLDTMPDTVLIVDPAANIVDANEAASNLTGLSREQLIGLPMSDFAKHMNGEMKPNVVQFRKPIAIRALAGEMVGEEHRRVKHPRTGTDIDLLLSAKPILDAKGEVKGALVVARDVTELAQLQQRLADIERHQAIGHVAAGIAHDFNNTLQTISQAVAVLQMSPDRSVEDRKVFLDMIQNAVRRGAEVIGRIRDYLRSGSATAGDIDVRAVLSEAIELTRPMWQSHPIEVQHELKPCGVVRGNRADLLRMFTNLIINSLQAMPEGGKLTLRCEGNSSAVQVHVRDTGQGIAPELRKRVFNPYFTTKAGGTGLGLSGAQKIMLELGGDISFTSELGEGTEFNLKFPRTKEAQEKKTA